MHRPRFDIAFLAMSLSFSLGIGVTEVVHQNSYVETRSESQPRQLREQPRVKPVVNTGIDPRCRSIDLDELSRMYDELNWEWMRLDDRGPLKAEKKVKRAELDSKIKQLKLYLDEHRYYHYNRDSYQNLVYREKCYAF